jgi:16S rRNA (guanine966-N2)-methyltransferase
MPKKGHRKPTRGAAQQGSRYGVQKGKCRIIAGKWRGRNIHFDDAEGLRPTTDRIRETVFSWLQVYLPNSYCLDCFAGSGVLGFEALSRGSQKVVFIEQNKSTADKLNDNVRALNTDDAIVVHDDALHWLELRSQESERAEAEEVSNTSPMRKFDLVFLDPPFHSDMLEPVCILLNRSGCLAENAIIYVEHSADENIVLPECWYRLKQKRSGRVVYNLYEKQCGNE